MAMPGMTVPRAVENPNYATNPRMQEAGGSTFAHATGGGLSGNPNHNSALFSEDIDLDNFNPSSNVRHQLYIPFDIS